MIREVAAMARPAAGALAALAGAVGLNVVSPLAPCERHVLVGLVLFCQFSATYVINDCFDVIQDKVNHPTRPLARGAVSPASAFCWGLALFALSLGFAAGLGWPAFAFTAVNSAVFFAYSMVKRSHGVAANLVAAYFVAAILLLAGIVGGAPLALGPMFLLLFAFVVGRELVCDIHDLPGDRQAALTTLATLRGRDAAFRAAWCILAAVSAGAMAYAALGPLRRPWLFVVLVGVALALYSAQLWGYQRRRDERRYRRVRAAGFVALALVIPALRSL